MNRDGDGRRQRWREHLYLANFALLFTHQIDSAYWQEWKLFHVPGGAPFNLVANLLLLVGALAGFASLIRGGRFGGAMALVLVGAGLFCFTIHTYFLATGHPEFHTPASIVLLWTVLVVSLWQGAVELAHRRAVAGGRSRSSA